MRVLIWTESFLPAIGGVELFVERLAASLQARGVDVSIVTGHRQPGLPDEELLDGVRVFRLPFYTALASRRAEAVASLRTRVIALKRQLRPQVVHVHSMGPGAVVHLETNRTWPVPTLLTMHGGVGPPYCSAGPMTVAKHLLSAADWIFCCSRAVHDQLQAVEGPQVSTRSSVRYCGVKEPSVTPSARPLDAPRLVSMGRLIHWKGYDVALTAFASVLARWPAVRFLIGGHGPERQRLQDQATALGIAGSVDFVGFVPPHEAPSLMNRATMVIVPSRREGFGLVAVEAALMERPVVASGVGGLMEAVEHETTGLLVAPDDSDGFARAMSRLLEDAGLADRMGRAGRKRAQELFSWDSCLDEHQARYQQLIEEAEDVRNGRTRPAQ